MAPSIADALDGSPTGQLHRRSTMAERDAKDLPARGGPRDKKQLDVLLYGTALVLAIAGGVWAVWDHFGGDEAPAPPLAEPAPDVPAGPPELVPDLPEVPDLSAGPPPPPTGPEDPRLAAIGVEMRYLSRARELLADHPAEALGVLEQHRRQYPQGGLSEEREAFAIEALVALGRTDVAERRYYDFLRDYPSSELASRLGTLLR